MLTIADVARRLNVSESTVYNLAEAGKLAGYRVGMGRGTWRFTEDDVSAYLESCRHQRRDAPRPGSVRLKHLR